MANVLYDTYKQLLLGAGLDLASLNIKVGLVDLADYTFSAAHDFLDDVDAGGGLVSSTANLATKTVTNGTFDADDATFSAVAGDPCEALVLYRDSGASATSELIAFFDTGVTGLPVTPNSGDIDLIFNGSGIFAL